MADSRRKTDSKKTRAPDTDTAAEARHTRLERLALLLYLEGGVAIVAGMVVLSMFLSNGSVPQKVWLPAAILGGILAVGILGTWLARRKTLAAA